MSGQQRRCDWVQASQGIVIASSAAAAAQGIEVLAAGGNAVDAAMAAARAMDPGPPLAGLFAAPGKPPVAELLNGGAPVPVVLCTSGPFMLASAGEELPQPSVDAVRVIACDAGGNVACIAGAIGALPWIALQDGAPVLVLSAPGAAPGPLVEGALVQGRPLAELAGGDVWLIRRRSDSALLEGAAAAAVLGISGGPAYSPPGINFFVAPI
jgi:hypothetical protein